MAVPDRIQQRKKQKGKLKKEFVAKDISFQSLGKIGNLLSRRYLFTIIVSFLITAFLVFFATWVTFDQNYMNMEPKGLPSITLQDTVLEKFDLSMDYALILANGVAESREISEKSKDLGSVAMTEDISVYFPSWEQQEKRIPLINEVRKTIQSSTS